MKRLISLMMPWADIWKGMATVSSADNVGKGWKETAGALA